ncbi:hypothetical protein DBR06_SOUSAS33710065, partial [Sousa chinensis]
KEPTINLGCKADFVVTGHLILGSFALGNEGWLISDQMDFE